MRKFLLLSVVLCFFSCIQTSKKENSISKHSIIPLPQKIEQGKYLLALDKGISFEFPEGEKWNKLKTIFKNYLTPKGLRTSDNGIPLKLNIDNSFSTDEAYHLNIDGKGISIKAKTESGAFYGLQSLVQLIDNQSIPYIKIEDAPRFAYRGMHLDVSRHFFPVDFIKRYIDLLSRYKMNRFHWHLTDDQGWRIEIKKYPKLQEIAAWRPETLIGHYNDTPQKFDGKRYGGFYSQEEVKEVVAYAAARQVEVIPEIEMPGHAQSTLAAYPELSCGNKDIIPATKWGVFEEVYCPNEETFEFLENVLLEVMELFPSQYIHVGGDECPKVRWENSAFCQNLMKKEGLKDEMELQSYFIKRMGRFIESHGRKFIGWDEILEGGLAEGAAVMSWRGTEGGIEAAKAGHDVVMTPTSHCYFDYYQSDDPNEPLAIGGLLPVEKVYGYEPVPEELTEEESKYVIGTQGNIWSEYLPKSSDVEYMLLPRMPALAEVAWTAESQKDFDSFAARLQKHFIDWEKEEINFANKTSDVRLDIKAGMGKPVQILTSTLLKDQSIELTKGNPEAFTKNENGYSLKQDAELTFSAMQNGKSVGRAASVNYIHHKAAGKKVTLTHEPAEKYSGNGDGSTFNGVLGNSERYGDKEWLGFDGTDFIADVEFGDATEISELKFRFFNGPGQWIYPPKKIIVSKLENGKYISLGESQSVEGKDKVVTSLVQFDKTNVQSIRIQVENYGTIPKGAQGAGNAAWLFVDEVLVR